jgi:glycogen debranching enzyme
MPMRFLNIFGRSLRDSIAIADTDTLSLKSPDGWLYASLDRFQCFFGRDAIISSLELLPNYPDIAKATLLHLMKTQGKETNIKREEEKGKVVHEERFVKDAYYNELVHEGFAFPYYGSSDATFLYILLAERYLQATGDTKTLEEIGQSLALAFSWINTTFDANGIIRVKNLNTEGDVSLSMINKNWLDSPLSLSYKDGTLSVSDPSNYPVAYLEIQAEFIGIMRGATILYPYLSSSTKTLVTELSHKAEKLSQSLDKFFMIDGGAYYAPAIDAHNRVFDITTSVPGYLLYTGSATLRQAEMIKRRLMQPDMRTPFGIRTLSTKEKRFDATSYQQGAVWPHDNWIIYEGFKKYNFTQEAMILKKSIFMAIRRLGFIPEFFNVTEKNKLIINQKAMKVQAWSCGAVISMFADGLPITIKKMKG